MKTSNGLKLKIVYSIVFLSLTFWALFAYYTMNQLIKTQAVYAKIINISGKQRMLSQKTALIAKRSFEKNQDYLINHTKELLQEMKDNHNFIINNLTSKKMEQIYFNSNGLDDHVKTYFSILDDFLKKMSFEKLEKIENYSFELLPRLDHAVYEFENESNKNTEELKLRELFILIGTLFTIILEALIIVIPSIRQNDSTRNKLNKMNESLKKKVSVEVKRIQQKDKIINEQSKMITMREVITNIAHQWRQPLCIITTCASGLKLKKEFNQLSDEDLNKDIDIILKNGEYLSGIIDMFREFFEEDSSNTVYAFRKIYETSIEAINHKLNTTEIEFITKIENLRYTGYENKLINVLIYIYQNAVDELKTKDYKKLIFTNIYKEDGEIIIEIIDNAGGIKEKILEKVFHPYFTTKHQSMGKGMSLYIVKESIEKVFKGKITVDNIAFENNNIEYTGAKFKISLPLRAL